jgi:hypothetical protein
MPDQPIQSGEFNAAMDGIRRTLDRMEKNQDAMDKRIDDLVTLHRECATRRERQAYEDGLEAGEINSLQGRVKVLEADKRATATFRRTFIASLALSLLTSLFALFHSK